MCGQPCAKPLPCGVHVCQRSCHAGQCQQPGQKCVQRCLIKRQECSHPCNALCHGHEPCPLTTCREVIKVRRTCNCVQKEIICNTKPKENTEAKSGAELTESLVQALSVRTIDLSLARKQQPNQLQLECDDECCIHQRNRNLAQALSINLDEPRASSVVYTDFLRDYAKRNFEFVQSVERDLAQLVEDTQRYRVSKRCHSFKPMKKNERHVVHELAHFYGLETESVDPEPQRNVIAYAVFGMCKAPTISLSETMRREKQKVPPPVTLIWTDFCTYLWSQLRFRSYFLSILFGSVFLVFTFSQNKRIYNERGGFSYFLSHGKRVADIHWKTGLLPNE